MKRNTKLITNSRSLTLRLTEDEVNFLAEKAEQDMQLSVSAYTSKLIRKYIQSQKEEE